MPLPQLSYIYRLIRFNVNGSAKQFMKKKFVMWYGNEVKKQVIARILLDSIECY